MLTARWPEAGPKGYEHGWRYVGPQAFLAGVAEKASGPGVQREKLLGGQSATTELVTLPDGMKIVHKTARPGGDPADVEFFMDGEELAPLVADAVKAPAAHTYRDHPGSVWVEHIDGTQDGADKLVDTPEGVRIGLLDALMGYGDQGLMVRDGKLVAFDYGGAWLPAELGDDRPNLRDPDSPMKHFVGDDDAWREDPPISATELDRIRERMEALHPEFKKAGRLTWLAYSLRALDEIRQHAGKADAVEEKSSEAHINGSMSFDDVKEAVRAALLARVRGLNGAEYCWIYVADLTATDVVYANMSDDLWQCSYSIDNGVVTLGDATEVVRTYMDAPAGEPEDEPGGDGMDAGEADGAVAEAWSADKHPRGKKGTSAGGQFAPLSYNSRTKTGSGYDKKAGDPNVKALQKELNRLGATDGKGNKLAVDGKLGPLTTSSTKKVQRALGLPATGKVTPELLARLRKAKTIKGLGAKPGPQEPKGAKPKNTATKTVPAKPSPAKKVVKLKEAVEESVRIVGRVLEAKGEDGDGGRVFGVRIIAYGDSKNRRRYPEAVMREAAHLYEGARAYDHHRSDEELRSSTIAGLVGSYRNVEATSEGLEGDLHLLPSAKHAAEALDATIAAQDEGLPPLIGLSHDVMARFRNVAEGGVQVQEATAITQVNSADLVADPAAGGKATRMVAGGTDGTGTEPAEIEEGDVPTKEEILAAFAEASDDELAAAGLARAAEATTEVEETTEPERETEAAGEPKTSFLAGLMIREKVKAAGLPEAVAEGVTAALPERITESDVDAHIAGIKNSLGLMERAGLTPAVGTAQVTQEARDKKVKALDAFFAGNFQEGYRSFHQAWEDFTGHRPRAWDTDVNKMILRESYGAYDSGDRMRVEEGQTRLRESMDSTTWNLVLGDSITRRMIAEYARPDLGMWRQIVSSIVPLMDFRTQRIDRVGGYGVLPDVAQGAPYQDLTSPTNQEVTYALGKKGGIESITFEMIANDDVRAISKIPVKLGLAAAQTLFRFIFDIFVANAAVTYDGVALFNGSHGNTGTSALSQSALSAVRTAMRQQAGYGDTKDILSIVPQTLIVPSALEELAWQLATSAVALPSGAPAGGASDTPNIHHRMSEPIVVDYYSDQNDWFTVADPSRVPTIEVGFYNGRQDPEMFTQSDPSVGSVFDADKITYKIRHMYSAAVLDHRGFYRNTL